MDVTSCVGRATAAPLPGYSPGRGLRLHALAGAARLRAVTALWLLSPQTPMLFQGQEFQASAPFHYFADMGAELAPAIARGRDGYILGPGVAFVFDILRPINDRTEECRRLFLDDGGALGVTGSRLRNADLASVLDE